MDLGAMRSWLNSNNEKYMITERTYHALLNEQETDIVEFRLVMPWGDMDYTASVLIPKAQVEADRDASLAKAWDRLGWETERDTRVKIDGPHGMNNGRCYQEGR